MVYFGPNDATALNTHMPVDHMLADATVEAKDSAAAPAEADKVRRRGFVSVVCGAWGLGSLDGW